MAHATLLRTNTTPVFPVSTDGAPRQLQRLQSAMSTSMAQPPRASQLSGSTAFASTTSLSSLTSSATMVPPPTNGQVVATSNIINQKADASRSLYQICVSLKQRLAQVPGFEQYMDQMEVWENADPDKSPVESLWNLMRTGHPLVHIYNALDPGNPAIEIAGAGTDAKKSKIAIFKFVEACMKELKIPMAESFVISDLTGNDTTGFVKVTSVVNLVLDRIQERGLLNQSELYLQDAPPDASLQMSYRDYIVRELVDTERKYVQDLENLHDLKRMLEQRGAIPGDTVHQIFLNINAILDFQRRFLIRVETTNSMPAAVQLWGNPFVSFEQYFEIYQPFIANQRRAAMVAQAHFDKIKSIEHPVACDFNTLDGFLLKPMQRLVKYPLLLKDLMKKSDDEGVKADLSAGIQAAERALQKANEAVDRDLLDDAMIDLMNRVDDWKSHKVDQFGRLLLHGVYTVLTGKSEQEKDYEIYLFECILLCCKEVSANKSKDKKDKTRSTGPKPRNRSAKLQLKGRIFMTNVTEVLSFSKPGSYTVQIWWKGDPGVENFVIKFQNEETMKKWAAGLDTQRKENAPQSTTSPDQATPDFTWMRNQMNNLENPYAQQEEDDEDLQGPTPTPSQYGGGMGGPPVLPGTMPRTSSSASLRARSATNDSNQSLAGIARAPPPPRFPLPVPPAPLSLQTQMSGGQSPSYRGGDSYFSPVGESPVSSRTSTASSIFPPSAGYTFPRTGQPQPGGWDGEQNRYTAPAMPRAPSRDGPSPVNAYGMINGRNPRGPSMPVMASHSAQNASQSRSRSYSTPDIQGQGPPGIRRTPGGSQSNVPAVPGIPPHLHPTHERHDSTIPRSNTGSPRNDLPIRSNTQSPGVQRDRLTQQGGGYGPTMAQFPTQPIYGRQGTPGPTSNPAGSMAPAPLNLSGDPGRTVSPPLGTAPAMVSPEMGMPTQLKVKVNYDSTNYMTLVAAYNITYQSLVDRIDAKLARFTNSSIGKGNLRLRYRDEDGDFVSIESDDDIQIAFMEWRDGVRNMYSGGVGEIELFCVENSG